MSKRKWLKFGKWESLIYFTGVTSPCQSPCYTLSSSFQEHRTEVGTTYIFMQNQESVVFLFFLFHSSYNSLKDLPILSKFVFKKSWSHLFFFLFIAGFDVAHMKTKNNMLSKLYLSCFKLNSLEGCHPEIKQKLLTENQSRTKICSPFLKSLEFKIWICFWKRQEMRKVPPKCMRRIQQTSGTYIYSLAYPSRTPAKIGWKYSMLSIQLHDKISQKKHT